MSQLDPMTYEFQRATASASASYDRSRSRELPITPPGSNDAPVPKCFPDRLSDWPEFATVQAQQIAQVMAMILFPALWL